MKNFIYSLSICIIFSCSYNSSRIIENQLDCEPTIPEFIIQLNILTNLVEEDPIDCINTYQKLDEVKCIYNNLSESDLITVQTIIDEESDNDDVTVRDAILQLEIFLSITCN